jgi:hypothetical protein
MTVSTSTLFFDIDFYLNMANISSSIKGAPNLILIIGTKVIE